MSSKYKIAEQVVKLLSAGQQKDGLKVSVQQAMHAVGQAANKIIRAFILSNKQMGVETIPFDIISSYSIKSEYDVDRDKWYVPLPVRALSGLPNNSGIHRVRLASDWGNDFVPLNEGFYSMYRDLDALMLESRPAYFPERDRLYLVGYSKDAMFDVKIIADVNDIDDLDQVPLMADMENDVVMLAVQILSSQIQMVRDETNNNSANI